MNLRHTAERMFLLGQSLCRYDGPSPEAIRKVAQQHDLPVERITQVSVLDPYLHY